jgi:hypothetical protein
MARQPPIHDAARQDETAHSSEAGRRPQFDLKHVFAAVTVAGLVFGAIHWLGLGGTIVLLFIVGTAVAGYSLPTSPRAKPLGACGGLLFGTLLVSCLVAGLLPAVGSGPPPRARIDCNNHLKMIGLGLQIYADVYKCFPPAYVADKDGRPMHSWRVLILPYIEEKPLYAQYDFNEPWDGPHNRLLASKMPRWYHCEKDMPSGGTSTSYVAITGPETLLSDDACSSFADVKDSTPNTLAIVEVAASGINWMEPRDLPFAALGRGVNPRAGRGISSCHPNGALVVFGDGHTDYLTDDTPIADLKALATKAGGEAISGDY